jgi:hypothetical protein
LHRPATDVDGSATRVEELDEVVAESGTAVAAAAVDLTDDDAGCRRIRGGRHQQ